MAQGSDLAGETWPKGIRSVGRSVGPLWVAACCEDDDLIMGRTLEGRSMGSVTPVCGTEAREVCFTLGASKGFHIGDVGVNI